MTPQAPRRRHARCMPASQVGRARQAADQARVCRARPPPYGPDGSSHIKKVLIAVVLRGEPLGRLLRRDEHDHPSPSSPSHRGDPPGHVPRCRPCRRRQLSRVTRYVRATGRLRLCRLPARGERRLAAVLPARRADGGARGRCARLGQRLRQADRGRRAAAHRGPAAGRRRRRASVGGRLGAAARGCSCGALHEVDDLHLAVEAGDSVGFLFRTGEVDLGARTRPRPDGAIQSFTQPCGPCGMDGGTGVELLYDAVVEPDVDADGLGDETQDPDGGGLGLDWEDDWFEDFEEGDELDATSKRTTRGGPAAPPAPDVERLPERRRRPAAQGPAAGAPERGASRCPPTAARAPDPSSRS